MRKGQLGFLQKLILILVGAILLFLVFGVAFLNKMQNSGDIEKCRSTAAIVDKGRDLTGAEIINLDCRMRELHIKPRDITFNGDLNKNMLFRDIAEEMRTCWYMMGDGQFQPFYQKYVGLATRPCVICSKITFDEKIAQNMGTLDGFNAFMDIRMEGSDKTYREYMSRAQTKGGGFILYWYDEVTTLGEVQDIDTAKNYYVVYNVVQHQKVTNAGASWYKAIQDIFGTEGGLYDANYLYLVKADSISEAGCDYIGNEAK